MRCRRLTSSWSTIALVPSGAYLAFWARGGIDHVGLSLRKLEEAGIARRTFYRYFTSKEELFDILVEESFVHLYEALGILLKERGKDPVRQLKRGLRLYVEWGLKHPSEYQIAFIVRNPTKKPYRTHRAFDVARALVKLCLGSSKAERELELRTQALWAATHGITSLLTQRPSFPWVSKQRLIDHVIDSAVQGALGPTKRPRSN